MLRPETARSIVERAAAVFFFASQLDVSRRRDAEEALAQAHKMEALGHSQAVSRTTSVTCFR